ncbi:cell division transport system ATP-binding protein [Anaerosphaera aminiphila DSM 21120]|uniref:Cell division ATP-binding protein FtsE n=1 Tax=Anaerosphaera aminiphila DSM 21120 TaxID=1120995 RepID=A0A1M5R4T1_9FIRM|nr:cell division ATP-binding protein FtsE [Anaerosphaera aminiphila]SHH21417.1 cell division transport system ATP-binding protein [Anaerosphaera aminiphila DSM 21120]
MIEFENVYKEYSNGVMALSNINISVPRGDFVFLVGNSGAGKSTMIKLLIREEKVTRGKILIGGTDITKLRKKDIPKLRRNISVVFQDFRLLDKKTIFENVAYALEIQGASKKEIKKSVNESLEIVGLSNRALSYPDELSGGESQRVSIARAIVNNAPILVCDEPTGNLDTDTAWEIMNALIKINERGTTVIMATHAVGIVDKMQKHVIKIANGCIATDVEKGGYYENN